jgi:hypothetical protein
MEHVKEQFKDAGNVVPQMVNDHLYQGNWAPGSGLGETERKKTKVGIYVEIR